MSILMEITHRIWSVRFLIIIIFLSFELASSTQATDQRKDEIFLNWFRSNNGTTFSIDIRVWQDQGRGVVAVANVTGGEEIMHIPAKLIISVENMKNSADPVNAATANMLSNGDDAVIAILLLEHWRNTTSFFAQYIAVLPAYIPSLLHFRQKELDELQDFDFERDALEFQKGALRSFHEIVSSVRSYWPVDAVASVTYEKYLWATTVINSRGLRFRGKVYLSPLADMFNYAPQSVKREADSGESFLLHHKLESSDGGSSLRIFADRAQLAGGQLYEDYGDNSDKVYLQYHGFVPTENPFRCVVLKTPKIPLDASPLLRKLLNQLQFPLGVSPTQCVQSSGQLGRTLEYYLATLSFNEQSLSICSNALSRGFEGFKDSQYWARVMAECGFTSISMATHSAVGSSVDHNSYNFTSFAVDLNDENEQRTVRALHYIQQWMKNTIPAYPTTVQNDEIVLSNLEAQDKENQQRESSESSDGTTHYPSHELLAVRYRVYQKRLYRSICQMYGINFSAQIDRLNSPGGQNKKFWGPPFVSFHSDAYTPLSEKLKLFNIWFHGAEFLQSKIIAAEFPMVRIGVMASENIQKGETYLSTPLGMIMDSAAASTDTIFGPLISSLRSTYKQTDDFHELLFFLLHERLVRHKHSRYWPYLRLLPVPGETSPPTGWSLQDIRNKLQPSLVTGLAEAHKNRTEGTYNHIIKVKEIDFFFPSGVLTFENYQWASEILDSRSIWWEGKRHLVPMLDFINCKEGPTGSTVHSTQVEVQNNQHHAAVTRAGWNFNKGEQLFENYGQPNHIYFTYHGFSLPDKENSHDCVLFEFNLSEQEMNRVNWDAEHVRGIAQELGMRTKGTHTACLKEMMPPGVWLFLSLKVTPKIKRRRNRRAPSSAVYGEYTNRPTEESKSVLLELVRERIKGYTLFFDQKSVALQGEDSQGKSVASKQFLRSELIMLERIVKSLNILDVYPEDDNDEL